MRVLFVDDEESVLSGLRRAFRPYRDQLAPTFAISGPEALEALEAEPFEAIVTDMRMPGMDGAELLGLVHERFPSVVRFVLSGYADSEAIMRTTNVAHQYLAKPSDPPTIISAVRRALGLRDLLRDERLVALANGVETLPVLPATYKALTSALSNPEVEVGEVVEIVEGDIAIAAKLLQLVNSAFFGVTRDVSSIAQSISYLGLETLRDLVLAEEIFRPGIGCSKALERKLPALQTHATQVAFLARQIACKTEVEASAFTAGLLHDVGFTLDDRWISDEDMDGTAALAEAKETIGAHHGELGAYLLGLWGLSYPIIEAVAYHSEPSRVRARPSEAGTLDALTAVHVAEALLVECGAASAAPLDESYLVARGFHDKLPHWRTLAERVAGQVD